MGGCVATDGLWQHALALPICPQDFIAVHWLTHVGVVFQASMNSLVLSLHPFPNTEVQSSAWPVVRQCWARRETALWCSWPWVKSLYIYIIPLPCPLYAQFSNVTWRRTGVPDRKFVKKIYLFPTQPWLPVFLEFITRDAYLCYHS